MQPWMRWALFGLFVVALLIIQFIPGTAAPGS
jgi:hypothetical protein